MALTSILYTGSSGFVGRNLSQYFRNNIEYGLIPLNIREQISLSSLKGKSIIHLAGKAHDTRNTSNSNEYFEINYELTKNLFDLYLESKIDDFIYFSSVKAACDTIDGILDENIIPNPLTPYGQSKQQAEAYLLSKKLPLGKRLFIIRPCMIHGPGNKGNLNLLYNVVKKGLPYPLAAFENKRSFLSIENLNYIIEKIISDEKVPGGIYNISDDEPLSTNQVITLMGEAEGRKARLWKIHTGLVRAIASIGDKLHLPLNSERLKKLTESYVVCNDKIKHALKIEKLPISSRDGLLVTIKSFLST